MPSYHPMHQGLNPHNLATYIANAGSVYATRRSHIDYIATQSTKPYNPAIVVCSIPNLSRLRDVPTPMVYINDVGNLRLIDVHGNDDLTSYLRPHPLMYS